MSKAYDVLRRQNLIEGQIGRGSYVVDPSVSQDQPFKLQSEPDNLFDMSISRPLFDRQHVDAFHSTLSDLQTSLDPALLLSTRPNIGHERHRKIGVNWLSLCGLETDVESVVMTNGVTHGMTAALSAIMRPGDLILSDVVTHHLMASSAVYLGYRHMGIDTDEHGICPDSLVHCFIRFAGKAVRVWFWHPQS